MSNRRAQQHANPGSSTGRRARQGMSVNANGFGERWDDADAAQSSTAPDDHRQIPGRQSGLLSAAGSSLQHGRRGYFGPYTGMQQARFQTPVRPQGRVSVPVYRSHSLRPSGMSQVKGVAGAAEAPRNTRQFPPDSLAQHRESLPAGTRNAAGYGADYALGHGTSLHIRSSNNPINVNGMSEVGNSRMSETSHGHWTPSLEQVSSGLIQDRGLITGMADQPLGYPSSITSNNMVSEFSHRLPLLPSATSTGSSPYVGGITGVAHGIQPFSSTHGSLPTSSLTAVVVTSHQKAPPPYVPLPIDTYDPESAHYRYKDELIDIGQMDKIGGSFAFCLEKFSLRLKRILHKICPCFYALFYSKESEYTIVKAILGFPFGLAVGFLFYYCVIDRLKLSAFMRFLLGSVTLLVMSMGYARSIKIRCIIWLIFPCFFGKSGRGILMTMAIGALLTGPVSNTMDNFRESVRTVTCMTELMINITVKRFELTGKPIFNIVKGFVGANKMDKMANGMRKALSPVKGEVEDTKETREAEYKAVRMDAELGTNRAEFFRTNEEKNAAVLGKEDGGTKTKAYKTDTAYLKKLDYRCNNIWGMAVDTCKKGFQGAWDKCLSAIPVIGYLICWPTKLDFFCYLVKLFPVPVKCDSSKMLNSGFGGAYGEGDDAGAELEKGMNVKLEYQVKPKDGKVDAVNIQHVQKGMKNEFGKKQRFFNFIITICERIMAFAFIQIFITSFQYYNSYATSIHFDNCYMSDYFRRIERRRRQRGRSCLIPLKKLESKILIEPTKWKQLPGERKKFSKGTLRLIINMVLFAMIFLFDWLICEILSIVARHSYVVYAQKGVHDIKLEVIGTGMLAKLVKSILKGFHERHELYHKFDNLICLPYPTKTPDIYYYKVFGTIGVIWILLYFEAYGLRLRRLICSFFFPKREKTRILSLYNSTLKKRAGYARSIRHQVRRLARERHLTMEYDTFTALRQQCPCLCGWLKLLGKGKASCAACKGKEDSTFHRCTTKGCKFTYCQSCWDDLRHHCYACSPEPADNESSLSEGPFDSDNDARDAADE